MMHGQTNIKRSGFRISFIVRVYTVSSSEDGTLGVVVISD